MDSISVRKFATLVGVSHVAVRKAIDKGYIKDGLVMNGVKPAIDYPIALKEWNERPGAKESVSMVGEEKETKKHNVRKEVRVKEILLSEQTEEKESSVVPILTKGFKHSDVTLVEAYYKAELKRLETLELKKVLVRKDAVFKQLFQLGNEIRAKFQAIPDKTIYDILASSENPNKANKILSDAISTVLEDISLKNVKF